MTPSAPDLAGNLSPTPADPVHPLKSQGLIDLYDPLRTRYIIIRSILSSVEAGSIPWSPVSSPHLPVSESVSAPSQHSPFCACRPLSAALRRCPRSLLGVVSSMQRMHVSTRSAHRRDNANEQDLRLARSAGVKGCILSNHGGRQLDRARSGFDSLRRIREQDPALLKELEVYVDGGARRGTDVLMALALGARGVGLGRPFLYAQAAYGEKGAIRAVRSECLFNISRSPSRDEGPISFRRPVPEPTAVRSVLNWQYWNGKSSPPCSSWASPSSISCGRRWWSV